VHAVPCKAFEGYELPAAPWLQFFRTAYPAKVRNEILLFGKLDDAFIVTLNAAFCAETAQMQQII